MIINNLDLRIMIKEKGLSNREISRCLNVSEMTISRWLNKTDLKPEKRDKLVFAINYLYQLKKSGRNRNTERVQA